MNDNNNMNLENNQNLITPINPELREITAGPVPVVPANTEPAKKSKKEPEPEDEDDWDDDDEDWDE